MNKKLLFLISPIIFAVSIFINISSVDAATEAEKLAFDKKETEILAQMNKVPALLREQAQELHNLTGNDLSLMEQIDVNKKIQITDLVRNLSTDLENFLINPGAEGLAAEKAKFESILKSSQEISNKIEEIINKYPNPSGIAAVEALRELHRNLNITFNDNLFFGDTPGLNVSLLAKINLISDYEKKLAPNQESSNNGGKPSKYMIVNNRAKNSKSLRYSLDGKNYNYATLVPGRNKFLVSLLQSFNGKIIYSVNGGGAQVFDAYFELSTSGEVVDCNALREVIDNTGAGEVRSRAIEKYNSQKCQPPLGSDATGTSGTRAGAGGTVVTPGGGNLPPRTTGSGGTTPTTPGGQTPKSGGTIETPSGSSFGYDPSVTAADPSKSEPGLETNVFKDIGALVGVALDAGAAAWRGVVGTLSGMFR